MPSKPDKRSSQRACAEMADARDRSRTTRATSDPRPDSAASTKSQQCRPPRIRGRRLLHTTASSTARGPPTFARCQGRFCTGHALLVRPRPHLLSAPSTLRRRSGWARRNADCRSPRGGRSRFRRIRTSSRVLRVHREGRREPTTHPARRTQSWSQALIRQPHRLRSAHSQHTSEVHMAAVSIGDLRSFPCKYRTLPDATGPPSALSRRKPGSESGSLGRVS